MVGHVERVVEISNEHSSLVDKQKRNRMLGEKHKKGLFQQQRRIYLPPGRSLIFLELSQHLGVSHWNFVKAWKFHFVNNLELSFVKIWNFYFIKK
jgi:hypothetical protein